MRFTGHSREKFYSPRKTAERKSHVLLSLSSRTATLSPPYPFSPPPRQGVWGSETRLPSARPPSSKPFEAERRGGRRSSRWSPPVTVAAGERSPSKLFLPTTPGERGRDEERGGGAVRESHSAFNTRRLRHRDSSLFVCPRTLLANNWDFFFFLPSAQIDYSSPLM